VLGCDVMEERDVGSDEMADDTNLKQKMPSRLVRWREQWKTAHCTCPSPC
jgi:hypothetical protein